MNIGELGELKRFEEPRRLPQTVSTVNKAKFENDEISVSVTKSGEEFIVQSNNKLNENTVGCTLIETSDLSEAMKVLRVFKKGVRVGRSTQTII